MTWTRSQAMPPPTDAHEDQCIHDLFALQAARTPDAVAVVFEKQQITYRELNQRSNRLAHYLRKLGVGPDVLVGICVERSLEMVIGLLAILKAGAAYVPLDPACPKERLTFILEDANVRLLLTEQRFIERVPKHSATVIQLDAGSEVIGRESDENPVSDVTAENLAYVIFTSGSTGRPKGVQIRHSSVVNLLSATQPLFRIDESDVWTVVHSYSFDFSVWEIWGCLLHGGRLVIVPVDVARSPVAFYDLLCRERVTILNQTPSAIRQLVQARQQTRGNTQRSYFSSHASRLPRNAFHDLSLRLIICGGEPFPRELASPLLEWNIPVWNFYGPTETTVWAAISHIETIDSTHRWASIGNLKVYLLDRHLQPVPPGVTGELYIGGAGLARGYHNRPDLTAEKFIPNLFSDEPGARLYRTGDLARYLPDRGIEFLGRIDHQVKIRGFRIELAEIESALGQHAGVREAVVMARDDPEDGGGGLPIAEVEAGNPKSKIGNLKSTEKRLVAYIVAERHPHSAIRELRSFLMEKLPDYMVPSEFVFLDALPLTPNGKVDRRSLPAPDPTRPESEQPFVAPRTPVEKELAKIWAEVLGLKQVGAYDDFFELGGHSLKASQIISRLRDAFQLELPLRSIFETSILTELAGIIEKNNREEDGPQLSPIQFIPRDGDLPLSFSQERTWFIQQLAPANLAYNFQAEIRFTGLLDVDALERSLNEIVRRHEIYRTTFPTVNGRPVQVIHQAPPVTLPVVDLQALSERERRASIEALVGKEFHKPFDLTQLPLVRWTLFKLSEQQYGLVHVEHHLIHDGWSFNVFLRELLELYKAFSAGNPSPLPELPFQFVDFASWQRQWMQEEAAATQLDYWTKKLAGGPPVLELPFGRQRPSFQRFHGAAPRVELPLSLCRSVRALSRQEGVTPFMTMLAAFVTLLSRYSGQSEICVGTGTANRRWRETEGLIGMIVNNIVLRTDLSGNPTVRQLLGRVREIVLEARAHEDLPFDKVVEALQPERDLSRNPLFQVMFNFHDAPMPDVQLPGMNVDLELVLSNGSAKFDLNVIVIPHFQQRVGLRPGAEPDGLTLVWEYNTDLFDDATITRMTRHYKALLEGIVANPAQPISELPLLTEGEKHQLVEWNDTGKNYPRGRCLHQLFEEQVERAPDGVAVVFEKQRLTYRELNRRANQLAHHLQKLGVGPEIQVGICLDRSLEMIVSLLGTLKAGGAYVPIDPTYPNERIAFVLEDAHAPVLLTQQSIVVKLPPHKGKAVCLDADREVIAAESEENPVSEVASDNLVYVIYTSGSTGKPKGVAIAHYSAVSLSYWARTIFTPEDLKGVLASTSICFDLSVFELFVPLSWGGKVILAKDVLQLPTLVASKEISLINTVPSAMVELLRVNGVPASVRAVNLAGEPLRTPLVKQIYEQGKIERVFDLYGPSEDTTYSTFALRNGNGPATIGRPIANTQIYLLDSHRQPVPMGVPGELYIAGDGLARGYLRRPELTAEKFLPNPFSGGPGARLYKTGDLARYLPDGNMEFLGRIDHQVKIRGFRIEPGEIESALGQHAAVREAVVMARDDPEDGVGGLSIAEVEAGNPKSKIRNLKSTEKRLVAYVVPHQGEALTVDGLRGFLKEKLPDYMVPSAFVLLNRLPLTPNGKVDRRALPAPDQSRPDLEDTFVAPRTPVEEALAKIWAEVLDIEKVGVHDNFFSLGGHSLLAIQVMSRVGKAFGLDLPLRTLFEKPTIEELSSAVMAVNEERLGRLVSEVEALSDEEAAQLFARAASKGIQ